MGKTGRIAARGGLSPDKYLTKEQTQRLLSYVKAQADLARARGSTRSVVDEIVCWLLIYGGLRASEVCNLRIRDLPISHGKNCLWIENSKGNVSRTVEIPSKLGKALARFCKVQRKNAKPDDFLFISSQGKAMCYMTVYQKVRRIGERAGIGRLHPHMLRHTYATQLYGVERDLLFVSDQLGHSNVGTTHIYARTDNESRRQQVESMVESQKSRENG